MLLKGNIDEMRNKSGTGWLLLFPLLGLLLADLLSRVCKALTKSSMVASYHQGVTESKANGNGKVSFLPLTFIFMCIAGSILNKVRKCFILY